VPGAFSAEQAALRIAAAPLGYAYRLGTGTCLTLGLVTPAGPDCRTDAIEDALGRSDHWILDGLPRSADLPAGRGGECSVQWSDDGSAIAIGDARFAPDALSAQGLAMGIADAMVLDGGPHRLAPRRQRHIATLRQQIARCRFRSDPAWACYDRWLGSMGGSPAALPLMQEVAAAGRLA
jgi:hypothetical protein